jgi:hypothetical protein
MSAMRNDAVSNNSIGSIICPVLIGDHKLTRQEMSAGAASMTDACARR